MLQHDVSVIGKQLVTCVPVASIDEAEQRFYTLAGLNAALEMAVIDLMNHAKEGTLDNRKARIRAAAAVEQNRAFYRNISNEQRS